MSHLKKLRATTLAERQLRLDAVAVRVGKLKGPASLDQYPLLDLALQVAAVAIAVAGTPGLHRRKIYGGDAIRRAFAASHRAPLSLLAHAYLAAVDFSLFPLENAMERVVVSAFLDEMDVRAFGLSLAGQPTFAVVV